MKLGISRQAMVAALFGAAAVGTLWISPKILSPEAGAQPIAIQPPSGAPMSFADLIEQVEPAVVSVNVLSERKVNDLGDMEQFFEQFRGLPGLDDFAGRVVHPQRWPEDLAVEGRRFVVIGSGATAMSLVPALAERGAGSDGRRGRPSAQSTPK